MKIRSVFFRRFEPNCGKNRHISQCWRILFKIPVFGSEGGWLPKFNQFFLVHRHICGKNFCEDPFSSFYVKLVTDRQTNDGHYITSLAHVTTLMEFCSPNNPSRRYQQLLTICFQPEIIEQRFHQIQATQTIDHLISYICVCTKTVNSNAVSISKPHQRLLHAAELPTRRYRMGSSTDCTNSTLTFTSFNGPHTDITLICRGPLPLPLPVHSSLNLWTAATVPHSSQSIARR